MWYAVFLLDDSEVMRVALEDATDFASADFAATLATESADFFEWDAYRIVFVQ